MLPSFLERQDLKNKNVLVTGACGFLGTQVCALLKELGANVIRIDPRVERKPSSNGTIKNLPLRVQDIELRENLRKIEFDLVFHLAGAAFAAQSVVEPYFDFESNLWATVQFLETLRALEFHGLIVYASSAAVYGEPAQLPITEETPPHPISPYGASKYASENYLNVYAELYDLNVIAARLFSLYGPGQRKQVVFDIARKALRQDTKIELLGTGEERRDLMYVQDAAAALVLLGTLPRVRARTINVCSGHAISIRGLAEKIVCALGENPERIAFSGIHRPGDPLVWEASDQLLSSTGFRTQVDLEEGIRRTVQWCKTELAAENTNALQPASLNE